MSENDFEKEIKRDLCWGILFHILGRQVDAENSLKNILESQKARGEFKDVSIKLINFIKFGPLEQLKDDQVFKRAEILLELIKDLDKILNPEPGKGPRLAYECSRNPKEGEASDNPEEGYSRDPFKTLGENDASNIALAAVIYLLRGYATFFCRPRNRRDFNAAKVSLNDFFQCNQLTWRLYRSLKSFCHSCTGSQNAYLQDVYKGADPQSAPEKSSYFIWSILLMLEIQRGNVYRQIDYLEEASRFYRHSQERLQRFEKKHSDSLLIDSKGIFGSRWTEFITPTVIRSIIEVSKVHFDLGYFLTSLKNQTLSLAYLVKMGNSESEEIYRENRKILIKDLASVMDFLDCESRQPIFDKELIEAYFGYRGNEIIPVGITKPIQPERFKDLISDEYLEFAVDILARIGFTLFTLKRRFLPDSSRTAEELGKIAKKQNEVNEWLRNFFTAHLTISTKRKNIKPSRLGQYCMSLVGDMATNINFDTVEKQFAHRIREKVNQDVLNKDNLTEDEFYQAILAGTTANILNIATIPRRNQKLLMRRGYRFRRGSGDLSQSSVYNGVKAAIGRLDPSERKESKTQNKLVVLRRWQSINPKIPRPGARMLRGGGYFLLWKGKGVVIDPGYDFIQNFYDEGFSLEDIDAVVVTHSHSDHDDDLATLTTLIREWNEYHELTGECEEKNSTKELDFFLNESSNLKFSAWLKSSEVKIARVIPLPSLWWDKESKEPSDGKIRGKPVKLDLRNEKIPEEGYSFEMEIVPAWHNDVIGKTEAIGIKFHLYEPKLEQGSSTFSFEKVGVIGYTGDTGAYGHDVTGLDRGGSKLIEDQYKDCDVLIAHLGDIRARELMTQMGQYGDEHPIQKLFNDWFVDPEDKEKFTPRRVRDFMRFLIALDFAPRKALLAKLSLSGSESKPLCVWLEMLTIFNDFENHEPISQITSEKLEQDLLEALDTIFKDMGFRLRVPVTISVTRNIQYRISQATLGLEERRVVSDRRVAWALLGFLCGFSMVPWQYPYHLGIYGLYLLFNSMIQNQDKQDGRIFIVSELPEELSSYRHQVARRLNAIKGNVKESKTDEIQRHVHALTGDIGLHINLNFEGGGLLPKIRCVYCNYNNETVILQKNYHKPSRIRETPLKRMNSSMIYLCTEHDHHPEIENSPRYFLSRPNLMVK